MTVVAAVGLGSRPFALALDLAAAEACQGLVEAEVEAAPNDDRLNVGEVKLVVVHASRPEFHPVGVVEIRIVVCEQSDNRSDGLIFKQRVV